MRIDEIASRVEYRMYEQNLLIFGILILFQIEIFLKIC